MATEPRTAPEPEPAPALVPAPAPKRSRRRLLLTIAGVVAVVLIAFGVRQWSYGRVHVTTDNAQVEGRVVPVLTRVGGYVTEVNADDNGQVRAGQTLVRIDDRDLRARLTQAEADLANAMAISGTGGGNGQASAQLGAAREAVVQAQANVKRTRADLQRYRDLAARGIVSRQQLDAAETAATNAQAALVAARDQVQGAGAGLQGARSRTESMRAARDQAALMLSYANVTSPADGVVSRRSVEVGQLVQPGQPLMSVVPLGDVWVVANLKETEVKDVVPGDRAKIQVDSYPGRVFTGHVESLSPATGARFSLLPPDNATGNFTKVVQRIPVRVRVDRTGDPNHPLRPGMSVKLTIDTKSALAARQMPAP
jgi:membrane fusion protein (multidrug efflux system)